MNKVHHHGGISIMGMVLEVRAGTVPESNGKKTSLIRAVSRHWRVVSHKVENLRKGHVIMESKIQGEKVQTCLWP